MANIYVRSTTGSNANSGAGWATAKATAVGADAIDAAGDTIFFSQNHNESTGGDVIIGYAGTPAAPQRWLCVNDSAEPPTTLATGATITSTTPSGTSGLFLNGWGYAYGLTFVSGTSRQMGFNTDDTREVGFEQCTFKFTSLSTVILQFGGVKGRITLKNCDVSFGSTSQKIQISSSFFHWDGGSILAGSAAITSLIGETAGTMAVIENVDLSNMAASATIFSAISAPQLHIIRNCKLPSSWNGSLATFSGVSLGRAEMYNCDSGTTNYRMWVKDYYGDIVSETTLIRTGGASDGTTGLSWKMTTTADGEFPGLVLRSPEIVQWNDTVGSSKTVTVEILHDSVTNLKDDEIWLEIEYLGSSSAPLGSNANDRKTNLLATGSDQTTSSAAWTTTGLTNPNKQKLQVTFTPQTKGYVHARVVSAKASYTLYVDPLLVIS